MMPHTYRLEILAGIAFIVFCGAFLYTSALNPGAKYSGSDTLGSAQISSLTGIPEENFQPLIPQWVPPSGEIESCLFALQAALGGIFVGGVFGYWIGQKKREN
jgi:cobalt/nickel transport protein